MLSISRVEVFNCLVDVAHIETVLLAKDMAAGEALHVGPQGSCTLRHNAKEVLCIARPQQRGHKESVTKIFTRGGNSATQVSTAQNLSL